jgi:hypothetical protein
VKSCGYLLARLSESARDRSRVRFRLHAISRAVKRSAALEGAANYRISRYSGERAGGVRDGARDREISGLLLRPTCITEQLAGDDGQEERPWSVRWGFGGEAAAQPEGGSQCRAVAGMASGVSRVVEEQIG